MEVEDAYRFPFAFHDFYNLQSMLSGVCISKFCDRLSSLCSFQIFGIRVIWEAAFMSMIFAACGRERAG